MFTRPAGRLGAACSIALCAAALAACGSDDEGGGSAAPSASSSQGAGGEVRAAEEFIAANATGKAGEAPSEAPTPAQGRNVWYVSCGSLIRPCQRAGEAIQAAGKALGWKVTVFDGKIDPAVWNRGIRQAVVDGADAIITGGVDCPPVKQALTAAKAKGIETVSMFSYDCNDPAFGGKGEAVYGHITQSGPKGTMADTGMLTGALEAAWAIKDSGGKAKVIQFDQADQAILAYIGKGFAAKMKECSGCEIVATVPLKLADLGPALTQKAQNALLQHPDATYAMAPNDPIALAVTQAVTSAGKAGKVKVLGSLGDPPNIQNIKAGRGQVMTVGFDTGWIGWAAMDDLVRLFADEKPVYSGWTVGMVDEANLPEGDQYKAPLDYEQAYTRAWGA